MYVKYTRNSLYFHVLIKEDIFAVFFPKTNVSKKKNF